MRLKRRHEAGAIIPTASMADIAFLLIVFFMVTITFEKDKTQVALPKTELRFEVPKEAAYISVTNIGQIRVTNGEEMSVPIPPDDVVTFAGVRSLDEVAEEMRRAHLFCLPSVRESGGSVLLEAMASSRPVRRWCW